MKPEPTPLKYFLAYTVLVCAWLLGLFAWQSTSAANLVSMTWLTSGIFAVLSAGFWLVALRRHSQQKANHQTDALIKFERLKLALDAAQEALWDWSLNEEQEVFFSTAYCAKLGYSQAEFGNSQQAWQSRLVPEERERIYRNVMDFIAEGDGDYDSTYRMQHKDGSQRWIHSRGRLMKNAQGVAVRFIGIAQDITEQRGADQRLQQANAVFESTQEGVLITDHANTIVHINPAFTRITGYSLEDVIGQTPRIFKSGRHSTEFYQAMWTTLEATDMWQGEIWNRRKDGAILPQYQTIRLLRDENGFISHNVAVFSDISVLQGTQAEQNYHSHYDPLTGLANRAQLHERLKAVLKMNNKQTGNAILLIDLDHFKQVNDSLGHHLGDQLLQAVTQRINSIASKNCTLARMDRDQFVAVCDTTHTSEQAAALAEKIINACKEPFTIDHKPLSISVSIGICMLAQTANSVAEVLHNLEAALAQAKTNGDASFAFASDAFINQQPETP